MIAGAILSSEILDYIRRQFGSDVYELVITENVTAAKELSR